MKKLSVGTESHAIVIAVSDNEGRRIYTHAGEIDDLSSPQEVAAVV